MLEGTKERSENMTSGNLFVKRLQDYIYYSNKIKFYIRTLLHYFIGCCTLIVSKNERLTSRFYSQMSLYKYIVFETKYNNIFQVFDLSQGVYYTQGYGYHKIIDKLKLLGIEQITIDSLQRPKKEKLKIYNSDVQIDFIMMVIMKSPLAIKQNIAIAYDTIIKNEIFYKERWNLVQIPKSIKDYLSFKEALIMIQITKTPFLGLDKNGKIKTYNNPKNDISKVLCIDELLHKYHHNLADLFQRLYITNSNFVHIVHNMKTINTIFTFRRYKNKFNTWIPVLIPNEQ